MDGGQVIPEEIRGLLDRRGTFREWLNRLDELGSEFRPEVAEKVRSDYAGRLARVEDELEGHRAGLETALVDRTEAVQQISSEHDERTAELEETKLRHVVGEFDDDEWESRRAGHQDLIDGLEAQLNSERSAVESLEAVLGEFAGEGALMASGIVAGSEEEPDVAVEEVEPPEPEDQVFAEDERAEPEATAGEEAAEEMTQVLDGEESEEPAAEDSDVVKAMLVDPTFEETTIAGADWAEVEVVGDETAEDLEVVEPAPAADEPDEFMDELEFLESLSLDDAENFDAVSAMLDEEEGESGADEDSNRKPEDL